MTGREEGDDGMKRGMSQLYVTLMMTFRLSK